MPRNWLVNLATVAVSVLAIILACELVVFRFVLLPSDVPRHAMIDGVVRYAPNQAGIWRLKNEVAALYTINRQGWNSGQGDYEIAKRPGVERVAIIGDSFVEAFQVPSSSSLAEKLGRRLGAGAEVFRFGIAGAPFSQYLWMFEHEVARYAPDLVVVVLIHNDFDESFRHGASRVASNFMKLSVVDGRVAAEIPPAPYDPPWWDALRFTATSRYFRNRQLLSRYTFLPAPPQFAGNTEMLARERPAVIAATDYVFARLAAATRQRGIRLLLLIDGDRNAIYAGGAGGAVLALNSIAAEAATRRGIALIDLHPRFAADWAARRERFEFASDYHWNERGHEIAAEAVHAWLRHDNR
jgi:lysophospholipase L1-like esterase